LTFLLAGSLEDVLRSDEHIGDEPRKPMGERDDEIISILLVHDFHDLWEFGLNQGMIEEMPVQEGIGMGGGTD
jgi:hypothetical protein